MENLILKYYSKELIIQKSYFTQWTGKHFNNLFRSQKKKRHNNTQYLQNNVLIDEGRIHLCCVESDTRICTDLYPYNAVILVIVACSFVSSFATNLKHRILLLSNHITKALVITILLNLLNLSRLGLGAYQVRSQSEPLPNLIL